VCDQIAVNSSVTLAETTLGTVIKCRHHDIGEEINMAVQPDSGGYELILRRETGGTHQPRLVLSFAAIQGRAECVRVEIGAPFAPGEDPTKLGARFAPKRLAPLDASTLRRIRLHTEIKGARKAWLGDLEEFATGYFQGYKISRSIREEARTRIGIAKETAKYDRPGPSHLGKDHFEKVALVYRDAYARGESPTLAVAGHFHVARSTAGRWVSIARNEHRLLPKTHRGKAKVRSTRQR